MRRIQLVVALLAGALAVALLSIHHSLDASQAHTQRGQFRLSRTKTIVVLGLDGLPGARGDLGDHLAHQGLLCYCW